MLYLSCHGNRAQWEEQRAAGSDAGVLKQSQIIGVWGKRLFSSKLIVLLSLNRGISMSTDSLIIDLSGKSSFISPTGVALSFRSVSQQVLLNTLNLSKDGNLFCGILGDFLNDFSAFQLMESKRVMNGREENEIIIYS